MSRNHCSHHIVWLFLFLRIKSFWKRWTAVQAMSKPNYIMLFRAIFFFINIPNENMYSYVMHRYYFSYTPTFGNIVCSMSVGIWIYDPSWHESWIICFIDIAWKHSPQLMRRSKSFGGTDSVESCCWKWSCWLKFGYIKYLRPLLNVERRELISSEDKEWFDNPWRLLEPIVIVW